MGPLAILEFWRSMRDDAGAAEALRRSEAQLAGDAPHRDERDAWIDWLEASTRPDFLQALGSPSERERWAGHTVELVDAIGYTLEDMLRVRARDHAGRAFFVERGPRAPRPWSYAQVRRRTRSIAAALLRHRERPPVVAMLCDNGVDGASCDLACLLHDVVVSPLSVHTDLDQLVWILDRLDADIAIADRDEHLKRLVAARARTRKRFEILALRDGRAVREGDAVLLDERLANLSPDEVDRILDARRRLGFDAPATVMFTSGSTGHPKGVVFSQRNLVTKRFARAAALPMVGDDELLVSYLPLFHTFGRFLEMLGMLFWRGTYVFAGGPSLDALVEGMREHHPTGLISIPLRWSQLRDQIHETMDTASTAEERAHAFHAVVGDRLRWGLSAAGYLDPRVFRSFHESGVQLCSGFGMTEATGGITMSPPGDYVDDTVGRPLPAIDVALDDDGQMRIAGPYVARYLQAEGEGLVCEPRVEIDGKEWIATGDLFRRLEGDHLCIVDRLKDIYKNDRGQTVAPQRAERALDGVPGVKRCFLVGDHRSWNVMLIVPDRTDPVLQSLGSAEEERGYFRRILTAANLTLAPFERAVDFELLDRDFDPERGEITPKQTYRRKVIERNFADVIEELYRTPVFEWRIEGWRVRMPRWVLRDLGGLEADLEATADALVDRRRQRRLRVGRHGDRLRLGSMAYRVEGSIVDLALFCRQPRLWLGNAELAGFLPCKHGWEVPHPGVGSYPVLAQPDAPSPDGELATGIPGDERALHEQLCRLAEDSDRAVDALRGLVARLDRIETRFADVIRARLVALSSHPREEVRCLAYQTLLLDEGAREQDPGFGAFLESGRSFLNEASIQRIATSRMGPRRLEALRGRLARYRAQLEWPAAGVVREQLEGVLRLLADFVRHHPYYYKPVRVELASWVLLREDPELSAFARDLLEELVAWFEAELESRHRPLDPRSWRDIAVFDPEVPPEVRARVEKLFAHTSFLEQAIVLIFEDDDFRLDAVRARGLWVSRVNAPGPYQHLRTSVNTRDGRHYDVLVILRDDMDGEAVLHTNYWMLAIGGFPLGPRALPRFGCARPELAAMALEFVTDLNVEERVRGLVAAGRVDHRRSEISDWRRLFVRAMAAIFRAWSHSGERVVPGQASPANVVVPEQDFRDGPVILSLAGWKPYEGPLSLVEPMLRNFYHRTCAQHAAAERMMSVEWIFAACREALGQERGRRFLEELGQELRGGASVASELLPALDTFLEGCDTRAWTSIPVQSAIDRYRDWLRVNPLATEEARLQQIDSLLPLYRLESQGDLARYQLYLDTAFARSSSEIRSTLAGLVDRLHLEPDVAALSRVELSDLQSMLSSDEEREAFRRMVFPRGGAGFDPELVPYGDEEHRQVTVRTRIVDRKGAAFESREAVEPSEIGQLYRLFARRRFPKSVSEFDRYLLAFDEGGRLVAGLCYQRARADVVHMDAVAVVPALEGRGLASALLEDFCRRQLESGVSVVQTTYFMRSFCEKRGFELHPRWSGLVRFLADRPEAGSPAEPS